LGTDVDIYMYMPWRGDLCIQRYTLQFLVYALS